MKGLPLVEDSILCGLVFAAGRHSLVTSDLNLFKQMLECDTYRGEHSTGVFSLFRPTNKQPVYKVKKSAVDGFEFTKSREFMEAMVYTHQSTYNKDLTINDLPKALFGHNRHATMGAVNAKNAHPFTHGHITLAHNGTLRNQSLLPDHKDFEVDSENICHSIAKIGVDETIQKLHGAYALFWFNAKDMTINFIRNDERPFHFVETSAGDFFGASEEDMIMWLMKRGKASRSIKRHFEAEVGVQYIFDVSNGCVLKEERKHELPRFQVQTQSHYNRWAATEYEDYYERTGTRDTRKTTEVKAGSTPSTGGSSGPILESFNRSEKLDLKIGSVIEFECFSFTPYKSRPDYGQLTGWMPSCGDYVEVQCHNIHKDQFVQDKMMSTTLISAYLYMHTVHFIGRDVFDPAEKIAPLTIEDTEALSSLEDDIPAVLLTTATGEIFAEKGWRTSNHNTCSNCDNPIPFEEITEVEIINGYCFCGECVKEMDEEEVDIGYPGLEEVLLLEDKKKENEKPEGWCEVCKTVHNEYMRTGNMSVAQWFALPLECPLKEQFRTKFRPTLSLNKGGESGESHARFPGEEGKVSDKKPLQGLVRVNGLYLNKEQWERMNTCRVCECRIPFYDAHRITFWADSPVCMDCQTGLSKEEL